MKKPWVTHTYLFYKTACNPTVCGLPAGAIMVLSKPCCHSIKGTFSTWETDCMIRLVNPTCISPLLFFSCYKSVPHLEHHTISWGYMAFRQSMDSGAGVMAGGKANLHPPQDCFTPWHRGLHSSYYSTQNLQWKTRGNFWAKHSWICGSHKSKNKNKNCLSSDRRWARS